MNSAILSVIFDASKLKKSQTKKIEKNYYFCNLLRMNISFLNRNKIIIKTKRSTVNKMIKYHISYTLKF